MDMLPQVVFKFPSSAEKKIFDALKNAELPSTTALHSLNLPEHDYKQWAEADFVIVSPKGVLVLEVKGGRVRCERGQWVMTDRGGADYIKRESPLDQARSARFALQKRLEGVIPAGLLNRINFGFGLMFPDVVFEESSVEWDAALIFDAVTYDRRQCKVWIEKLYRYWSEKTGRKELLSDSEVASLIKAMRPDLDRVPALISRVGTAVEDLVQLTEDQYRYLDGLLLQPRVVVEGGAGTGKTFLAAEASRRLSRSGKDVLYICRSPVLAWNMREKLNTSMVDVLYFSALIEKSQQGKLPDFDVLVVDEGQDFLDMDSILFLDGLFDGGLEKGRWLFFMDSNNQGSMYEGVDPDAKAYLQSAGIPWPLYDNCRNTRQIATATMLLTGGDIGRAKVKGDGLKVEYIYCRDETDAVHEVEEQLTRWIDDEHVLPGDITVLSMTDWEHSLIGNLNKRWLRRFQVVDATAGCQWHQSSVTFSSVLDFKGLENRYIIVVDLDLFEGLKNDISKLYVGMTRANAVVSLIVPQMLKPKFDQYQLDNLLALRAHLMDEEN
ncbi:nuclease-related domain-containing DEAD/DEAH box helicase [Shewanella algae]|uniref:nuclease-related domain-containing DEAD/DEAH box helicase n=1 Tax=Shewanella algae TaxID=38313 RepID=UPI001AAD0E74|nr:NERD domain-containing protein [Shewanella algae]QTE80910.1 NERD domain-containing protein [Shewanella algae]